ncbi:hypothetical protein J1N35_034304 [Gossypium stocksii]|uniref:Uncharacterized protein n=1 Tax=Gossypium stocksii TaxID=47602 RepID=A0A9D3UTN9_9ROSI|nr:hypothetical protein J1N35_034304 [Gossypium stocksii]
MIITISTMESEFVTLDKSGEDVKRLQNFLENISDWPKPMPIICIYCDNQAKIGRVQNVTYNELGDVHNHLNIPMRTKTLPGEGVQIQTRQGWGALAQHGQCEMFILFRPKNNL